MQKAKILAVVGIVGLFAALVTATPAMAWHPKGQIVKKVQNITTGSELADANTEAEAVEVKPGDIIKYVITVSNTAAPASKQHNDLAFVKMTDQLPEGVELVSVKTRTISEDLGLIVPQKSVTKEYQLKVTSEIDGDIIINKACFTGNSVVKDNPQQGCDTAVIRVKLPPEEPKIPETPKTPETPEAPKETPKTPETPAVIPKTGPEAAVLSGAVGLSSLSYAGYSVLRSRRDVINKMLNR